VDKARIIEDHYGRPNSVGGGGMYGGGMRMNMMGNNGGGLPMISKWSQSTDFSIFFPLPELVTLAFM